MVIHDNNMMKYKELVPFLDETWERKPDIGNRSTIKEVSLLRQ